MCHHGTGNREASPTYKYSTCLLPGKIYLQLLNSFVATDEHPTTHKAAHVALQQLQLSTPQQNMTCLCGTRKPIHQ